MHLKCRQPVPTTYGWSWLNENNDSQINHYTQRLFRFFDPPHNDNKLDFTLHIDLPPTRVIILIAHINDNPMIGYPGHYYKSSSSSIVMPESFPVLSYTSGPGNVTMNITLIPFGTVQFYLFAFEVDESVSMMIEQFTTTDYPVTDDNKRLYEQHIFVNSGELAIFSSNRFCRITTYIECNSTCTVSIFANGTITGYKNDNTFILNIDMGVIPWNYTLARTFSGVVKLYFEVISGGVFNIAVHGANSKLFGHKYLAYAEAINGVLSQANTVPVAGLNCHNGYNSICLSCKADIIWKGQVAFPHQQVELIIHMKDYQCPAVREWYYLTLQHAILNAQNQANSTSIM